MSVMSRTWSGPSGHWHRDACRTWEGIRNLTRREIEPGGEGVEENILLGGTEVPRLMVFGAYTDGLKEYYVDKPQCQI